MQDNAYAYVDGYETWSSPCWSLAICGLGSGDMTGGWFAHAGVADVSTWAPSTTGAAAVHAAAHCAHAKQLRRPPTRAVSPAHMRRLTAGVFWGATPLMMPPSITFTMTLHPQRTRAAAAPVMAQPCRHWR